MDSNKLKLLGIMLFLKFSILIAIIVSLTIVKPMAMAAHNDAKKVCSLVMKADECVKHC